MLKSLKAWMADFRWPIAVLLIGLLGLLSPLLTTYFQQDEWHNFGYHMVELSTRNDLVWAGQQIFKPLGAAQIFNVFNYSVFGVQAVFPFTVTVVLVMLNLLLWVRLTQKLHIPAWIGYSSGILATLSLTSIQALDWALVSVAIQATWVCMQLSVLNWLAVTTSTSKIKLQQLGLCLVWALVAFSFKFNAVMLFVLLPITWLLWNPGFPQLIERMVSSKRLLLVSCLVLAGVTVTAGLFFISHPRLELTERTVLTATLQPFNSLGVLMIDDPSFFYRVSTRLLTGYFQLELDHQVAYTVVTNVMTLAVSSAFLFLVIGLQALKPFTSLTKRQLLFGGAVLVSSIVPYSFDVVSVGSPILESRYYHPGVFGFFLVVVLLLQQLMNVSQRWPDRLKTAWQASILGGLLLLVGYKAIQVQTSLHTIQAYTYSRYELYQTITTFLTDRESFIIYLDESNYPNPSIPNVLGQMVQTGVLYPTVVLLVDQGSLQPTIIDDAYWDLNFQGVIREGKQVVGIAYQAEELELILNEHPDLAADVVTLRVDYQTLRELPQLPFLPAQLPYVEYQLEPGHDVF